MEKFLVPSAKKEWDLFVPSHPEQETPQKNLFEKALNQLNQWFRVWESPIATSEIDTEETPFGTDSEVSEKIRVPEDVIQSILASLKNFEQEKGYLDRDLDLPLLAKAIGTNHSYLSRVVNHVKGKPFKHYLNDMRIEHAYIDLHVNPIKRRFTVEAIAFDNGFRSAESFSKKFKERYHCYPSEFLKRLAAFETQR